VNADAVRRERRAARRRILRVLTQRRLARQLGPGSTGVRLAQASICSTGRMPTDS
jgi:hypothetical protein